MCSRPDLETCASLRGIACTPVPTSCPLKVPFPILEMGIIPDSSIYRVCWGLPRWGSNKCFEGWECPYHGWLLISQADFKTQRSKPAWPYPRAHEDKDDMVITKFQAQEERFHMDGVLASTSSSEINTRFSCTEELPCAVEKPAQCGEREAEFRLSFIFRGKQWREKLPDPWPRGSSSPWRRSLPSLVGGAAL